MKYELTLAFTDTYDNAKEFWKYVLSLRYNVIDYQQGMGKPDLLIFGDSNFGVQHRSEEWEDVHKLFYTGENVRPDWFDTDFACTFDFDSSIEHYRLPLYVLEMWALTKEGFDYDHLFRKRKDTDWEKVFDEKQGFCSFVQSNPNVPFRNWFFGSMQKAFDGKIASGGPLYNNIGYVIDRPGGHFSKHHFIEKYKFNIAFENGSYPGYVTEKLLNAFYANSIPIYWGSPVIGIDFNPNAFVNVHDYVPTVDGQVQIRKTWLDDLWYQINMLDTVKQAYCSMMAQDPITPYKNGQTSIHNLLDWFDVVVFPRINKRN